MNQSVVFRGTLLLIGFLLVGTSLALASTQDQSISVSVPVGSYDISTTAFGHKVFVDNFGYLLVPGNPSLPSKIFAIAIPPGTEVIDINFNTGEGVVLTGEYDISPSPLPRVIGEENPDLYEQDKQRYEDNYNAVYNSDDAYPSLVAEKVRQAGYRKYNLVDVRVTPFQYYPLSKRLIYYPDITIEVNYRPTDRPVEAIIDNKDKTERIARNIILNYDQAHTWHPQIAPSDRELHDFVIITINSLTSSITTLVDWETAKGRIVEVVTTSWISSNYTGYDLAEKIRKFLREKYPSGEWGIEDVLIVGHYNEVPMRRTEQDLGYGKPETDFYYAELSNPDSTSWDANGNHLYGEDSDPIDFYSEVNVGRIPWSDPVIVQHICEKSVAYEQNNDPSFKNNILLLGAFFWDDDPNPRTDNAELMEAKVDQPWMTDWTMTRMYELGFSTFPMDYNITNSNVVSVWSNGTFAFVNWAGHGSPISSHIYHGSGDAFISSSNCPLLNDDYPAIIFADACSNSDTDYLNIGQAMMQQGGVGFVGATKVALGCPGWNGQYDGSSQSLDYFFTTYVTSGDYTIGEAHQQALRDMYTYGLWSYNKYETFEWGALWGNPGLGMGESEPRPLTILFPEGMPEYLEPGIPTTFTVQIENGSESFVQDSGLLHYRYDDGEFQTSQLISSGDNLYMATFASPNCEALPEFYISGEGDGGSTVTSPVDAPVSVYTSSVGILITMITDDFETDLGWSVSGDATDGHWERGVPAGDGDRGDPLVDYDGSGQCCLTDNVAGNSDVDGGTTYLTSPIIDLSDGNGIISFALWYSNNAGDNPNSDLFKVWVSNNDGFSWVEAAVFGPGTIDIWSEHSFSVEDFVSPSSTVRVRFEASDLDGGSVVEAAVDAFSVKILDCEMPGYAYLPGDANMYNGAWPPAVIGSDVTYLVNYFRAIPTSMPCLLDGFWCSTDANGDCNVIGSDVTYLVNYMRGGSSPQYCVDYESLWPTPADLPAEAPSGWPNCDPPAMNIETKLLPTGSGK